MRFYLLLKCNKLLVKYWKKRGLKIGDGVTISRTAYFDTEPYLIELGNYVKISNGVRFVTHDGGAHVFRNLSIEDENIDIFKGKTIVGDNCFIGNNVTIMPGVRIGKNTVIGFGSIVTSDIPDNSVACGIPARVDETIEE